MDNIFKIKKIMRIKTRDINGNYVWLDTETGKTTPVFPT